MLGAGARQWSPAAAPHGTPVDASTVSSLRSTPARELQLPRTIPGFHRITPQPHSVRRALRTSTPASGSFAQCAFGTRHDQVVPSAHGCRSARCTHRASPTPTVPLAQSAPATAGLTDPNQGSPPRLGWVTAEQSALPTFRQLSRALLLQLRTIQEEGRQRLMETCRSHGVPPPSRIPLLSEDPQRILLDHELQRALSALIRHHGFSLVTVAELIRGQSEGDYRPNKALSPERYKILLAGYKHQQFLITVAQQGIVPSWSRQAPLQSRLPENHKSTRRHLNAVLKSIRQGQDAGQYLVLDEDVLSLCGPVQISPLGAVEKKDVAAELEVRVIHDLSYPNGSATNDFSLRECLPSIEYRHMAAVARRIEFCHRQYPSATISILKGDVKGAFRHLMVASGHVRWMAARIPERKALVFDLAAPFGWTCSPTCYGAFGGAISWLLGRESPASMNPSSTDVDCFFAYEWVDDHVLVEPDSSDRLFLAEQTLRLAMLAILGPTPVNEDKFSKWSTTLEVLGLEFDTHLRTVSMPSAKISKALGRVSRLQMQHHTTRHELQCVLGSLRHVCTCLRSARPFFQHLQGAMLKAPRRGRIPVSSALHQDLQWFSWILKFGRLRALPTALFVDETPADAHFYMDASDDGLVVLHPSRRQFIQLRFDAMERSLIAQGTTFTINVRELFSVALAAWLFGPELTPDSGGGITLVRVWVDNATAVAWSNRLASANPMAQELIRAIGLAEAMFGLRMSARHLPGRMNTMADVGSRAWGEPYQSQWSNLSAAWHQVPVPTNIRKIYSAFSMNFKPSQWPSARDPSTRPAGASGVSGATRGVTRRGYPTTSGPSRTNSSGLLFLSGSDRTSAGHPLSQLRPCCPSLAQSLGIIKGTVATRPASTPDTKWLCEGCSGCLPAPREKNPSHLVSSEPCVVGATLPPPTTAYFGGLRSWATSFY